MTGTTCCPICGAVCDHCYDLGDATVFICSSCGGYRLSGTALVLLDKGTIDPPDPEWFRDLVNRKRGNSSEYPLIHSGDLGA